jgi:hypothetical protein
MKLSKTLAGAALALGLAASAVAAATVTRTYDAGGYKYTCVEMGGAEYCGNFNVVSGG